MEDLFPKNADGKLLRQRTAHYLIEQMGFVVANPTEFLGNDRQLRYKLLQQAKSLAVALEEPFETLQRLAFAVSKEDTFLPSDKLQQGYRKAS